MKRLRFLRPVAATAVAAVALAGLFGCSQGGGSSSGGSATGKLTDVSIHVYPGALTTIAAQVAQSEGIFQKHGINAQLIGFASGPAATQAMLSGGLNVVNSAPSVEYVSNETLASTGSKERIKAIMGSMGPLFYSLVGRKGVNWPSSSDPTAVLKSLEGKTVGVTGLAADTQNVLVGLMKEKGLDPSKTTFVAVGIGQSAVAALTTGQVDAAVATPPTGETMTAGGGKMLIDFRKGDIDKLLDPWIQSAWWATQSWLDKNPTTAEHLQDAFLETQKYMEDPKHLNEIAKVFAAQSQGLDMADARTAIKNIIPITEAKVSCQAVDNVSKFYTTYTTVFKDSVSCADFAWSTSNSWVTK